MTDIGFYHLTRQSEERALARLLGRTLDTGKRAVVLAPDAARVRALDLALWEQTDILFLPHGTEALGHADLQPVWLTADDALANGAPNAADFLFQLGRASDHLGRFARAFDLFDGREADAVAAARLRWKSAKDAGHTLAYWREGDRGWERAP